MYLFSSLKEKFYRLFGKSSVSPKQSDEEILAQQLKEQRVMDMVRRNRVRLQLNEKMANQVDQPTYGKEMLQRLTSNIPPAPLYHADHGGAIDFHPARN